MRSPRSSFRNLLAVVLLPVMAALSQAAEKFNPGYTADETVWPNAKSFRNSDPWIAAHHDTIQRLEPRVLVVNYANDVTMEGVRERAEKIIAALAESTRYHGYSDPEAPAVLHYKVFAYVDLRDKAPPKGREHRNSRHLEWLSGPDGGRTGCDYGQFFREPFTRKAKIPDPRGRSKPISLEDMIHLGLVHELWFYCIHDEEGAPLETIEEKQYYDENLKPIPGRHGPAGNGHCSFLPWVGRSFRATFFNPHRGIGCGMENFGHALEGMAHYNFCPYFRKYFYEFAEFDLDARYGLPFGSFYAAPEEDGWKVRYPSPTSLQYHRGGKVETLEGYTAVAGNVHFPPGAGGDYDMTANVPVRSTIEHYRLRDGEGGRDRAEDWKMERFYRYNDLAPDGMGPWMVYWRQSMPGLGNRCVDDAGKPMKNWWIFLFY